MMVAIQKAAGGPVYEVVGNRGDRSLRRRAESVTAFILTQIFLSGFHMRSHLTHLTSLLHSYVEPTEQLPGHTPHLCEVLSVWEKLLTRKIRHRVQTVYYFNCKIIKCLEEG